MRFADGPVPAGTGELEAALRAGLSALGVSGGSGVGGVGGTAPDSTGPDPTGPDSTGPDGAGSDSSTRAALSAAFDAQCASRQLDVAARRLQTAGRGYYTIGSSGHEANAFVALATRPSDPALLHYRSGGFYLARGAQVPGVDPIRDVLAGLMNSVEDPISRGRHKVFGNPALSIIPQTSTISSHLPRAVGLALAVHRARKLGADSVWPPDSVVVCSFGDASANHSTAVGAINTAINTAFRGLPVPVLFVCEDNGIGVSVPTPRGWIEQAYGSRPGLHYVAADGFDAVDTYQSACAAADLARSSRQPVFLHLRCVRFLAHAGSDAEITYRTAAQISGDYSRDPLLGTATALVAAGAASEGELLLRYDEIGERVTSTVESLWETTSLATVEDVIRPLSPRTPEAVAELSATMVPAAPTTAAAPTPLPAETPGTTGAAGRTLAESINGALAAILEAVPQALVFGEDVGRKGGVYGVTRSLARRFGAARVFDTILDEQAILGMALGGALTGLLPIPEIQYLAYLHNAEDQLRGEAASLSFFSAGQYRNPMVVRIAGLAYQKGFGGHFHNDNGVAVLRDIPGLVVACPARGDDAAGMLATCVAAGLVDGTVSAFLEPIALYHERDLHEPGDGGWLSTPDAPVPVGSARRYPPPALPAGGPTREFRLPRPVAAVPRHAAPDQPPADPPADSSGPPADLSLVTFGNGVRMSLRVARLLAEEAISASVLDLRWLAPLPIADVLAEARATRRVLVVDETRHSGGVGEAVLAGLVEGGFAGPMARVASRDSFIPLGPAAGHVLLGEADILAAARTLAARIR